MHLLLESVRIERGAFHMGPIDLGVEAGELVWIDGVNGAGKSTLLETIAGLHPLHTGRIEMDGETVATPDHAVPPVERDTTILLQRHGLWPHLTVKRQCLLVATGRGAAGLAERANQLGVSELLTRRPSGLSGGEAQRVAFLRALARDASLILLDEPYSAQHPDGVERVDQVMAALRDEGKTIVVAGHRSPPAARSFEL